MNKIHEAIRKFDSFLSSATRKETDENIAVYEHWIECRYDIEKELKEVKDKQEQRLLIELPCEVGDTVYQIGKGHYEIGTDITEYTVTAITMSQKDITISVKDENQLGFPISAVYLGKRLYLTRSEAEEALAKMGGSHEDTD